RRFAPVKTTSDLLALRSDAYVLTPEARVEPAPERSNGPPLVDLDGRFYKLIADFDARFPAGAPSLVRCRRLEILGDVAFGRGVAVRGAVRIEHDADRQLHIDDGAVLEGWCARSSSPRGAGATPTPKGSACCASTTTGGCWASTRRARRGPPWSTPRSTSSSRPSSSGSTAGGGWTGRRTSSPT